MSVNYYLSWIFSVHQLLFALHISEAFLTSVALNCLFLVFLYLTSKIIFYPPLGKWMLHIPVIVIEVPRKSSTFMNIANKSTFISMTEGLYALRTYLHFFLQRLRWLQYRMQNENIFAKFSRNFKRAKGHGSGRRGGGRGQLGIWSTQIKYSCTL